MQKSVCIIVDYFDNLLASSTMLANVDNGALGKHQPFFGGLRGIHTVIGSGFGGHCYFGCSFRWPYRRLTRGKVRRRGSYSAGEPRGTHQGIGFGRSPGVLVGAILSWQPSSSTPNPTGLPTRRVWVCKMGAQSARHPVHFLSARQVACPAPTQVWSSDGLCGASRLFRWPVPGG